MIRIIETEQELTVQGHATPPGKRTEKGSLACASITALVHGLIVSITMDAGRAPIYRFERGDFYLSKEGLTEHGRLFVWSFIQSARMVASCYHDYITVDAPGPREEPTTTTEEAGR